MISYAPEVKAALDGGRPVVALETTIVTHGMPYPVNVRTARSLEEIIRAEGAVPATIAIMDGTIRIGISDLELERLAHAGDVRKLSRADLADALVKRHLGATTVAATMLIAARAGIRVFATGGIGGVHRGAERTFDASADLSELARSAVTVVCAGAKAILDIPKTLEVLETLGVPTIGYGTDRFPAFYSRESGLRAPLRCDTPEDVAALVQMQRSLGMTGGVLVGNPIPHEAEIPFAEMQAHVDAAIAAADARGIGGKELTPFLLGDVLVRTGGRSLGANVALVENNARLAARIARALASASSKS
jgi:pseudouridine-5'-phosphate glycosidase